MLTVVYKGEAQFHSTLKVRCFFVVFIFFGMGSNYSNHQNVFGHKYNTILKAYMDHHLPVFDIN